MTSVTTLASRSAAPTSKPTTGKSHQIDPIQLHVDAVNAASMATFYARKGNHAGAARKAVQALAALRQLAAFERQAVTV